MLRWSTVRRSGYIPPQGLTQKFRSGAMLSLANGFDLGSHLWWQRNRVRHGNTRHTSILSPGKLE